MTTKIFDLRDLDMVSAYDWSQYGPVTHGDVMLVADGVAVMCEAWPCMVAGESDVFHRPADGVTWERFALDCPRPGMAERLLAGVAVARLPLRALVAVAELTGPSVDQLAAVATFAARHGRTWRAALAAAWSTGRDTAEPGGHLLRQVRNEHGPAWLATVTLADLGAMPARGAA